MIAFVIHGGFNIWSPNSGAQLSWQREIAADGRMTAGDKQVASSSLAAPAKTEAEVDTSLLVDEVCHLNINNKFNEVISNI